MSDIKRVQYVTPDLLEKVNPRNNELWQKYLNGKHSLAPKTRYAYTSDMNQFFVFLLRNYDNKYLLDFATDDAADMLDDFVAMCTSILGNRDRRIARRLSTISSMYIYFKKKRRIIENPVELLERPRIMKDKHVIKQTFLTKEQVEQIREELTKQNETQILCFFNVGLCTMARVNALCNIRIDQIDFEKKRIDRVIEKEGYEVTLMLDTRCIESINTWLNERKEKGIECDYLFTTKYDGNYHGIDVSTAQSNWIKKIGTIINEPDLHCHDLRHSGSDLRYKAGMSLEAVSHALNHKSTQVTSDFYLQKDIDKLQNEMEQFDV